MNDFDYDSADIITALQDAQDRIYCGTDCFICCALESVLGKSELTLYLQNMIDNKLCGYATLKIWLIEIAGIDVWGVMEYNVERNYKMRVTRLAWIDDMIDEFANLGE